LIEDLPGAKTKQPGVTFTNMYWLLGLHIYKAILKPIWTYGIQLWGTVSTSNIEIHRKSITFPIENLAYDSGYTLVCFVSCYPKGSANTSS
jgi:hypothetical protein